MFRPDSPPPRQPSPDFLPAPLPYPHHPRRIQSQPKIRVHSPALPPGLHSRTRTLQSARSCDCMTSSSSSSRTRTHAQLPISSSSSPASSGRNTPDDFTPRHRRTLSVAFPVPVPATPSLSMSSRSSSPIGGDTEQQVPPVPLVPYRYTGPQHIICPRPVSLAKQILLSPDVDEIQIRVVPAATEPLPRRMAVADFQERDQERKYTTPPPVQAPVPPLEKHKSMGIACLKFFGLRTPTTRQPRTAMAAM